MWVADQLAGIPVHNTGISVRLPEPFDHAHLSDAIDLVSARHRMLRSYCAFDDEFELVLRDTGRGPVLERSSGLPADVPSVELSRRPAWWVGVVAEPHPRLLAVFHHALVDPWSLRLVIEEIRLAHQSRAEGAPFPELPAPGDYREHAELMRARSADPDPDSLAYWRRVLASVPQLPSGVSDMLRSNPAGAGGVVRRDLSHTWSRLRRLAMQRRVTPFAILLTASARAVHEGLGVADFLAVMPVVSRETESVDRTVGCFTDLAVVRLGGADLPVEQQIEETFTSLADSLHHHIPYQALLDRCDPTRGSGTPNGHDLVAVTLYPSQGSPSVSPCWEVEPLDLPAVSHAVELGFQHDSESLTMVLHHGRGVTATVAHAIADAITRLLEDLGASAD